jgi:hypothetical protein
MAMVYGSFNKVAGTIELPGPSKYGVSPSSCCLFDFIRMRLCNIDIISQSIGADQTYIPASEIEGIEPNVA